VSASPPLLEVDRLRVEFQTRRGTLAAVEDVSFAIGRGEVLGVVGESGAGKSLTGMAIIGLLEPPGRIASGEIRLDGRRIDDLPQNELRRIRGRRIGAIFQDPLTSLNPLYTVGQQLVETIRTHLPVSRQEARHARWPCCVKPASRRRSSASTSTRTSFPAACGSGQSSRWRCAPSPS
jgi:peptide/nickel transport system ATP-binding protein